MSLVQRAYVVYEGSVVFTVDLESGIVECAELYSSTLKHIDTGLAEQPNSPSEWLPLHARARDLVDTEPRAAPLCWSGED